MDTTDTTTDDSDGHHLREIPNQRRMSITFSKLPSNPTAEEKAKLYVTMKDFISSINNRDSKYILSGIQLWFKELEMFNSIEKAEGLFTFLHESGLNKNDSNDPLVFINGFTDESSNLFEFFDHTNRRVKHRLNMPDNIDEISNEMIKNILNKMKNIFTELKLMSQRTDPFEENDLENEAISCCLDLILEQIGSKESKIKIGSKESKITEAQRVNLKSLRRSVVKAWIHARLANCLHPLRRLLSSYSTPAFLAYEWGTPDSIYSSNEIRSCESWVPMKQNVVELFEYSFKGTDAITAKDVNVFTTKTANYGNAYVAYIVKEHFAMVSFQWFDQGITGLWKRSPITVKYFEETSLEVSVTVVTGIYQVFKKKWDEIVEESEKEGSPFHNFLLDTKKITIGGHSQGAALSQLFLLQLIYYRYKHNNNKPMPLDCKVVALRCPSIFKFEDMNHEEKFYETFNAAVEQQPSPITFLKKAIVNINHPIDFYGFNTIFNYLKSKYHFDFNLDVNHPIDAVLWLFDFLLRFGKFLSIGTNIKCSNIMLSSGKDIKAQVQEYKWLRHIDFGDAINNFYNNKNGTSVTKKEDVNAKTEQSQSLQEYLDSIEDNTEEAEKICDNIQKWFDGLNNYDYNDLEGIMQYLNESGLKTDTHDNPWVCKNGFDVNESNLTQFKDQFVKLELKYEPDGDGIIRETFIEDFSFDDRRDDPCAEDETERNFIQEALSRHKKERKNIAFAWVHARLGLCLAPLRLYLSGLTTPAFLAYEWGDLVHSVEIRSKDTWMPMRDTVVQIFNKTNLSNASTIAPQHIETHTIKDQYGLRRTYLAYIGGQDDYAMVIFTGTNHWRVLWLTDAWASTEEVTYFAGTQLQVKVKVHSGIYYMFMRVWDKILAKTTENSSSKDAPILLQAKTITVGGHSLGASLSHLFALKLIEYRYLENNKPHANESVHLNLIVTTYACPAVFLFDHRKYKKTSFTKSFTKAYARISKGSFDDVITNFNNFNDKFVWIPRYYFLGFTSVGADVCFQRDCGGDVVKEHIMAYRWLKCANFGEAKEYFKETPKWWTMIVDEPARIKTLRYVAFAIFALVYLGIVWTYQFKFMGIVLTYYFKGTYFLFFIYLWMGACLLVGIYSLLEYYNFLK